jgi:hypothetical protein
MKEAVPKNVSCRRCKFGRTGAVGVAGITMDGTVAAGTATATAATGMAGITAAGVTDISVAEHSKVEYRGKPQSVSQAGNVYSGSP